MRVLIATSECKPYCKTGGLGDIAFSLSYELTKLGIQTDVILPYYEVIQNKHLPLEEVHHFQVYTNYHNVDTRIFRLHEKGVNYFFVEQNQFFYRDRLYGYFDDPLRYAAFNLAVIEFLKRSDDAFDIMQCNDWQMGMLPLLCRHNNLRVKTLLTIHNPLFQGYTSRQSLKDFFNLDYYYFDSGIVKFNDQVAYLKAGIVCADKVNTVSKNHARELLADMTCFNGLGYIIHMREKDFSGITNGLDHSEFDPTKDTKIPVTFNYETREKGKVAALKEIGKTLLFDFDANHRPLVYGVVSRLTDQKGVQKIIDLIPLIAVTGGKLIVLGSGDSYYENRFEHFRYLYPENVHIYRGYSDKMAHLIYAASDFYLMPSAFEPCGISQLIAMRYGALPIVSNVGGLIDTVKSFGTYKDPTGFTFNYNDYDDLNKMFIWAYRVSQNKEEFQKMIKNAMEYDSSWKNTINEYIKLFNEMMK